MLLKIPRYVAPVLFCLGIAGAAGAQTTTPGPLPGLAVTLNDVPSPGVENDGNFSALVPFAQEARNASSTGTFEFKIDFAQQSSTSAANQNIAVVVAAEGANVSNTQLFLVSPPTGTPPQSTLTPIGSPYVIPTDTPVSSISMRTDLTFEGCTQARTGATVSVTVGVTGGTQPLESMTSVTAIECVNAYEVVIENDSTAGGGNSSYEYGSVVYDTSIAGPPIDATASGTTASFNDTATMGTHGLITVSFDPGRATGSAARNIYTTLNSGPLQPTAIRNEAGDIINAANLVVPGLLSGAPGEVESLTLNLRVPSEIVSVGVGSPGYVRFGAIPIQNIAQIVVPLRSVGMRANPYRDGIVLQLASSAALSAILDSGAVAFTGGRVVFSDTNIGSLNNEVPSQVVLLDALNVNAAGCGQFDWVADPSNSVWGGNIFWIAGHGPNVTEVMARFTNSADASKNTTVPLTGLDLSGVPIQITQAELNAANSGFGVADVEFLLVGANGSTLDCDRLLQPRPTDLLFSFGNDRISSGHGDD